MMSANETVVMPSENDSTLWHYTSRDAAVGIVTGRSLWATSILYLNDSAEFLHVRDLVNKWIEGMPEHLWPGPSPANHRYRGRLQVFVRFLSRQLNKFKALNTFVISFSTLADDLSQWRAYGTSGGFCLGFSSDRLRQLAENHGFELVQCIYDDEEKEAQVDQLMKAFLEEFNLVDADLTDDDLSSGLGIYSDLKPSPRLQGLGDDFFLQAQQLASRIKSKAFAAECEWRLVSTEKPPANAVNFRNSASMLIPYRVFGLTAEGSNIPLIKIIAGPSPHVDLNLLAMIELCKTREVFGATAMQSKISYRYW